MIAPRRAKASRRGFVLVAVLWILVALAAFVAVYSVYVSDTAVGARARDDGFLAQGLATAAVELAALKLLSVPVAERPASGQVSFRMGQADVEARFRGEKARIDLNGASRELLAGLFTALGAAPPDSGRYADAIVAWRTPTDAGDADDAFRPAGPDDAPRGGPFVHAQEVWRVRGLPPALVTAALPVLTVYNGRNELNLKEADPLVRAAVESAAAGGDVGSGLPGESRQAQAGSQIAAATGTVSTGGEAVRVRVRIAFASGRTRGAEAVILLNDFDADPYRVLTWSDDVDPARAMP